MYGNLFRILLATLGAAHPLVKRMKSKIDDAAKKGKDKDDKVVDFPKTEVATTGTDLRAATNELDIERANELQLKDFEKDLKKLIDLGPDRFNKLPIDQQGNAFRNVKRFERRILQDPSRKQGIASLEQPEAPVFEIRSGKQVEGEGLESIQQRFGLPKDAPGPRKSKLDAGIIELKRKTGEVQEAANDLVEAENKLQSDMKGGAEKLRKLKQMGELRGLARQFIIEDIKAGRLKNLSPGMRKGMLEPTGSGLDGDPIDVIQRYYGGDALEVLAMLSKKYGSGPRAFDSAKQDLKNKVDIQENFELYPLDFPDPAPFSPKRKIPLTQVEVVNFLTGRDKDGNPIPQELLDFYNKNFDFYDDASNSQAYLRRFINDENDQQEFLKNLPSSLNTEAALEVGSIKGIKTGKKLNAEQIENFKYKPSKQTQTLPMRLIMDFDQPFNSETLLNEGYDVDQVDVLMQARRILQTGEESNPNEALLRVKEEIAEKRGVDVEDVKDIDFQIETPDPDDRVEAPGLPNILMV